MIATNALLPAAWSPVVPAPPPARFVVGIPEDQLELQAAPRSVGRQQMSNWCWAACIQMVLNFHGIPASQAAIVAGTYGALVDLPAGLPQVAAALEGWKVDIQGRPARVLVDAAHVDAATVASDLARRQPLIVGLAGHGYVLTGAQGHLDPLGRPVLDSVILRDPWPGNPSRKVMPMGEFLQGYQWAARVLVAR